MGSDLTEVEEIVEEDKEQSFPDSPRVRQVENQQKVEQQGEELLPEPEPEAIPICPLAADPRITFSFKFILLFVS